MPTYVITADLEIYLHINLHFSKHGLAKTKHKLKHRELRYSLQKVN